MVADDNEVRFENKRTVADFLFQFSSRKDPQANKIAGKMLQVLKKGQNLKQPMNPRT